MAKIAEQRYTTMPVDKLSLHPDNPNHGDTAAIGGSIAENDFVGAVVVQKSTNRILGGNHTYLAAKEQGLTKIPAIVIDADDRRAAKLLVALNRTRDLASYDERALVELLDGIDDLAGTGFNPADLGDLRRTSGLLGDAAAAFLDTTTAATDTARPAAPVTDSGPARPTADSTTPAASPGTAEAPGDAATARLRYVQVAWTLTPEQRDVIRQALAHIQSHRDDADTQPAALVALAQHYLNHTKEETP